MKKFGARVKAEVGAVLKKRDADNQAWRRDVEAELADMRDYIANIRFAEFFVCAWQRENPHSPCFPTV